VTDPSISAPTRHSARRVGAVAFAVMTLALMGVLGACGKDRVAVPRPLADALATMQESGGYTFTATVDTGTSSITTSGTFQAPNRIAQMVSRTGSSPVVMVLDGATVHVQDPTSGAWSTQPATTTSTIDLRRTFVALSSPTSMKQSDSTYTFTLTNEATRTLAGSGTEGAAKVTTTVGSVGLAQLTYEVTVNGQPVIVTIDYRDVGTAPAVTVPT